MMISSIVPRDDKYDSQRAEAEDLPCLPEKVVCGIGGRESVASQD